MAIKQAKSGIVETERGLTIAGTRITLYDIMDYLKQDWPPKLIRDWLDITDDQIGAAMSYIASHRDEVEAEYQLVVEEAEATRAYWEERNRERLTELRKLPPLPGREDFVEKLRALKAKLGLS